MTFAARARARISSSIGIPPGHDYGVDARRDRHLLNVRPVADEEDDVAVSVFLQARTERILRHGADHEELFSGFRRERSRDEGSGERGDDIRERSRDAARRPRFFPRREKVMAHLECAQQAEAPVRLIDHRQSAHLFLLDELDGIIDR